MQKCTSSHMTGYFIHIPLYADIPFNYFESFRTLHAVSIPCMMSPYHVQAIETSKCGAYFSDSFFITHKPVAAIM